MRTRWWSRRALGLHAAGLAVVVACLGLGWWQLSRALAGNTLSWVYTFEWPFFAGYAVYMWWKLVHEPLAETRAPEIAARRSSEAAVARSTVAAAGETVGESSLAETSLGDLGFDPYDESDPELAAYNRYLASLHVSDRARRSRT